MTLTELSERVDAGVVNLSILKTGHARAIRFSTLTRLCQALLSGHHPHQAQLRLAVLAENPSAPINAARAVPALLAAVKGAFTLAAHG